jgi:hypothetical protein
MFNQEIYDYLKETTPSLAATYLKSHPEQSQIKRIRIWPLQNKWWHHKRFDPVKKQYKFLEPHLIELGGSKHRHTHKEACRFLSGQPNEFAMKHTVVNNGHRRIPAFLKLNCKVSIAARIGCSVSSVEDYLRSFVRLGILKSHNLGNGKKLYSVDDAQNAMKTRNLNEPLQIEIINSQGEKVVYNFR